MKILVEKEFRYGGETYGEGEEIDLPERVGEKVIEKGYGRKIREEGMEPAEKPPKIENTPGPTEKKTESSGKEPLTIPVKTGGKDLDRRDALLRKPAGQRELEEAESDQAAEEVDERRRGDRKRGRALLPHAHQGHQHLPHFAGTRHEGQAARQRKCEIICSTGVEK